MKLNLLKPLKRIFTALSGEETEDKNLVSVMDKIADVVEENGGSGGSGASLPLIVDATITTSPNQARLNKTCLEIKNAYIGGRIVLLHVVETDGVPIPDSQFFFSVYGVVRDVNSTTTTFLCSTTASNAWPSKFYAESDDDYPIGYRTPS